MIYQSVLKDDRVLYTKRNGGDMRMSDGGHKRGFVTIATGDDRYYQLARDLLRSYRCVALDGVPFAIICDREHELTCEFDDTVILNNAHGSYLDKLELYFHSPYEETIFVDADALFLKDPKQLWGDFEEMGDFSSYGKPLSLDSGKGWFDYRQTGEFQKHLKFGVQMHGGLYYFRKTDQCREIFERAKYIADHYSEYRFSHFVEPADEPVLALSMAVSGCRPCAAQERVVFMPSYEGRLGVTAEGHLLVDKKESDAIILHFGTINTCRFLYRYLRVVVENRYHKVQKHLSRKFYRELKLKCLWVDIKIPISRRFKRFIKYSVPEKFFLRLRKLIKKNKY